MNSWRTEVTLSPSSAYFSRTVPDTGAAGIPCFLLEDGTVTLVPEEAGLKSRPLAEGTSCNLDGSGC